MANPKLGDAKVDKILTQFSQKYTNDNYVSTEILPIQSVKEKTGKFAKYGKENLRVYSDQTFRAPGTRANEVDYSVSQGTYVCQEHSLEKRVPDEFVDNTDDPYDPKRDATATLLDNIWVNNENALAQFMTNTSNLTQNTTLSGTSQWSDYANSDPIDDIETGITTVRSNTAQRPNSVVMSFEVMRELKAHPDIREQLKYTGGGQLSEGAFVDFMADFFNLENVYIGDAIKNTAQEGQSDSLSNVWNKDFILFYQNPRPTMMQATFGYTFTDVERTVETYREESHKSDVVRVRWSYDQNVMDASLAYLIKDAVA